MKDAKCPHCESTGTMTGTVWGIDLYQCVHCGELVHGYEAGIAAKRPFAPWGRCKDCQEPLEVLFNVPECRLCRERKRRNNASEK